MRKTTPSEAKLLSLGEKLMKKIWIMLDEEGHLTFWIKSRPDKMERFTGTDDQYFDDRLASQRLENYWREFGL